MTDSTNIEEMNKRALKAQERYQLPTGARQILLIRHGSSTGATQNTVQLGALTLSDPDLTQDGQAQALLLAAHLYHESLTGIFITPLRRTQQTAAPLAALTGLTPVVINDLREVYLGDFEHNFYQHARNGHKLVRQMFAEESWDAIPNAETSADFAARLRRGIEAVASATPPGATVAAFSHAAAIAEICRQATGSRAFAFTAPDNTSVTRLVVQANGHWKLRSYNELSHLGYD